MWALVSDSRFRLRSPGGAGGWAVRGAGSEKGNRRKEGAVGCTGEAGSGAAVGQGWRQRCRIEDLPFRSSFRVVKMGIRLGISRLWGAAVCQ